MAIMLEHPMPPGQPASSFSGTFFVTIKMTNMPKNTAVLVNVEIMFQATEKIAADLGF